MSTMKEYCQIIKTVASENGFTIEGTDVEFIIDKDQWHSVAFLIKINNAEYAQVHQWEEEKSGKDVEFGRAVYSLRNLSDVIKFCQIIVASTEIHARR